jgi:hypothetical protein
MAPEIANGRYGREIDTYALGIILFEMLTGHVPFEGESVGEVLMKHLTAEPDLSVLQEPYYDIVKRALAKDPEVRIKNVGELVAMLPGSESASGFARMDAQTIPHAPGAPPAISAAAPSSVRADARQAAKDGWEHLKSAVNEADTRVVQTVYGSDAEEPIAKAIRAAFASIRKRWTGEDTQRLSGVQKVGLILAVLFLFTWFTHGDALGVAIRCLVVYAIYYAIWASLIRPSIRRHSGEAALTPESPKRAPEPAKSQQYTAQAPSEQTIAWTPNDKSPTSSISRYEEAQRRRRSRTNWRDRAHAQLAAKSMREKLTELCGSMLLAALFSAVAASAVPLLSSSQPTSEIMATYCWLAIVGTLGSWAIMVPAKLIEGRLEDHVPMRITLMLLGAILGVVAWAVANGLMIRLDVASPPIDVERGLVSHEMLGWARTEHGANPPAAVYIAYFAFLFLIPRWWRQAEFTRSTRMSLWSIISCVFFAWLVHVFWWFPQPLGMAAAGVISLSTQLASPWMTPSQRRSISEMAEQAVTS